MLVPAAVLLTGGLWSVEKWRRHMYMYRVMYSVQVRKTFRTGLCIMLMHRTDMSGWMLRPAVCVFNYLYVGNM